MSPLPVDLDSETIQFDGHWYTRDDLARRIKAMLDAGDFQVSRPGQALEQLTGSIANLRAVSVKMTAEMAEAVAQVAARQGRAVGAVIREAGAPHLCPPAEAHPPQPPPPAPVPLTTPVTPATA